MSLLLSMLFLSPFIENIKHRWFLILYSCVLLLSKQLRLFVNNIGISTTGRDFFEYYSSIQFFIIVLAIILLTGIQRTISIICSLCFALYCFSVYLLWLNNLVDYFDVIAYFCILIHICLITYTERSIIKNILMLIFVGIATIGQERFI